MFFAACNNPSATDNANATKEIVIKRERSRSSSFNLSVEKIQIEHFENQFELVSICKIQYNCTLTENSCLFIPSNYYKFIFTKI